MEIVCMGQVYGKKAPKINTCLKNAGFKNLLLDLSLFCSEYELEHKEEAYEKRLAEKCADERIFLPNEPERMDETVCKYHIPGIKDNKWVVSIAKAPTLPVDTKREDLDSLIGKLTLESMKVSKKVGADYIIIEPLTKSSRNKEFYLSFVSAAKELGVKILVKNRYDSIYGHSVRGLFSDSYRLAEFIDDLNNSCGDEIFGLCMDIGVCNILGQNMYEFASVLGNRIKAVVLRENDGVHDSALLPFTCADKGQDKMDWLNLIRGLRRIQFDGALIVDFRDTLGAHSHLLWAKLTELAFENAKYIEWQLSIENTIKKYDKRVLFGAGNMCRNYMKCYGIDFPPLYTCDNNKALWDTQFAGLTVKNPECLRDLSPDTAIFICNIYYSEIEEQLRSMGITNPIEYFNDEYMPSFYFRRIDAETREEIH